LKFLKLSNIENRSCCKTGPTINASLNEMPLIDLLDANITLNLVMTPLRHNDAPNNIAIENLHYLIESFAYALILDIHA